MTRDAESKYAGHQAVSANNDRAGARSEEIMNQTMDTISTRRREERLSTWLVAATCFIVLLPITLIARLSGWRYRPWPPGPTGYGSVIEETRVMARNVAGIALSV